MNRLLATLTMVGFLCSASAGHSASDKEDVLKTSTGNVYMKFLGHASMLFQYNKKNIYIDPSSAYAKFDNLPKADIIIITHEHYDHLDLKAINEIRKKSTIIVATEACMAASPNIIMKNGDSKEEDGIKIEAVPAYNIVHKTEQGQLFHPKGNGNGYVLTIGGKRIYIAGDTENIPEMKQLKNIDIAFLPLNLPYTMDITMFVDAAKMVKPKILYPYHCYGSNLEQAKAALSNEKGIEVRIKNFY